MPGTNLADRDERLGIRVAQRPQQDAVDDREDGNGGAKRQRQRTDDGCGIEPITPQATPRVTKVVQKLAHAV